MALRYEHEVCVPTSTRWVASTAYEESLRGSQLLDVVDARRSVTCDEKARPPWRVCSDKALKLELLIKKALFSKFQFWYIIKVVRLCLVFEMRRKT
jgi:hypothetical protein